MKNANEEADVRRILVVDGHPIPRHGLVTLIKSSPDLTVCGETGDSDEVLKAIITLKPNAIVIDVTLRNGNGLDLIRKIRSQHNGLAILVFSHHDEAIFAPRAIRAGARGYVMKHESPEIVLEAIRTILDEQVYLSNRIARRMLSQVINGDRFDDATPLSRLSDREIQVFELIGRCTGSRDIAEQLKVSIKTVEAHRTHIKKKLALRNSTELIGQAVQWVHRIPAISSVIKSDRESNRLPPTDATEAIKVPV